MKLSKFLLVGAALCYGTSAIAQTVLPTAPTPPTIVTTSPNEVTAAAVATTNKVYIDQEGGNVDVNVVQTGEVLTSVTVEKNLWRFKQKETTNEAE